MNKLLRKKYSLFIALLILSIGLFAGIYLTGQSQDIRNRADVSPTSLCANGGFTTSGGERYCFIINNDIKHKEQAELACQQYGSGASFLDGDTRQDVLDVIARFNQDKSALYQNTSGGDAEDGAYITDTCSALKEHYGDNQSDLYYDEGKSGKLDCSEKKLSLSRNGHGKINDTEDGKGRGGVCELAAATPTSTPTNTPTSIPTNTPTQTPTNTPTNTPTHTPTPTSGFGGFRPTATPTRRPTVTPTRRPTTIPTVTASPTLSLFPSLSPTPFVPSEPPTLIVNPFTNDKKEAPSSFTLTGTASPNAQITIEISPDGIFGTATADETGQWRYILTQKLTPGAKQLRVTATDINGISTTYTEDFTVPRGGIGGWIWTILGLLAAIVVFIIIRRRMNQPPPYIPPAGGPPATPQAAPFIPEKPQVPQDTLSQDTLS